MCSVREIVNTAAREDFKNLVPNSPRFRNLNSPGGKSDCSSEKDLFNVKQSLLNHYMNTPV